MGRQRQLFNNNIKYSYVKDDVYFINFTFEYVDTLNFEKLLKECYRRSKHKIVQKVVFDLSKVNFFEIFELGLLNVWIIDLKKQGKEIMVKFPTQESQLYEFLENYGFEKFLKKNSVEYIKEKEARREPYVGFKRAFFLPLVFYHEKEFQDYIEALPALEVLKDADIVKDGSFKHVIIKELRDNIKIHAKDRYPYIAMTKHPTVPTEKEKFRSMIKGKAQYGLKWEREFFTNLLTLPNRSYFTLILGDMGPGIPKLLGKIEECKNMKEYEIVDYAFEHDTTSDPERRLDPVEKWIKEDIEDYKDFPPATGLYWVKEILKKYNGFLSARTGKTILSYNFLPNLVTGKVSDRPLTNWTVKDKKLKNLCAFPGTHYKIYFPLQRLSWEKKKKIYFEVPFHEEIRFRAERIPLKKYFSKDESVDSQWAGLKKIFDEIKEKTRNLKQKVLSNEMMVLIEDFVDISGDKMRKVLHYLILDLMRRQNPSLISIGVNINKETLTDIKVAGQKIKELSKGKGRNLVVFDKNFEIHFIGTDAEEEKVLEKLKQTSFTDNQISQEERAVIEKNEHLIRILNEKYVLHLPLKYIFNQIRENIENEIKNFILDGNNNIYHPTVRVNINKRYYVEGFFELYKLIEDDYWRDKLQKWIQWELKFTNAAWIVSMGRNINTLIEPIDKYGKNWLHIDNTLERLPYASLLRLGKSAKIIIVTELIGSGKTLNEVLDFLKLADCEILKVSAFVDARSYGKGIKDREFEHKGKSYKLESIIRQPLKFFDNKPPHWSYDDILKVDRTTNALLLKPIVLAEKAMWQRMDPRNYEDESGERVQDFENPFIEEIIASTVSVIRGHIISKNKHMTYFFITEKIAERYVKEISEKIINDIKEIKSDTNITHILYPEYNPGAKLIAKYIARLLPNVTLKSIKANEIYGASVEEINWKEKIGKIQTGIILDDSFSTGFTVRRLIDIAYEAGPPKFIFAYILMDRAGPFTKRFLTSISGYGRRKDISQIRVRYLSDAQIPIFDSSNCPICKYIEKLEDLKQEMGKLKLEGNEQFKNLLNEEIEKRRPLDIEFLSAHGYLPTSSNQIEKCMIRWRLEIAKEKIGARNELRRKAEHNSKFMLTMLNVIYDEIMYFFEIEISKFDEVFYKTFKKEIKEACKKFSIDEQILFDNLGAIILVWYLLIIKDTRKIRKEKEEEISDFYKNLIDIFNITLRKDAEFFWKTILHILIGEFITGDTHLDKLLDAIITFYHSSYKSTDSQTATSIKQLIEFLQRKTEKLTLPSVYRYYRDTITAPYYYDSTHKNMLNFLENKDLEKAKKTFDTSITRIKTNNLRGLELLLESEEMLTRPERENLEGLYTEIQSLVNMYESQRENANLGKTREYCTKFKETLDKVREVTSNLECNLSETFNLALSEKEISELIEKYQIEIERNFKAEFAFIRKQDMREIWKELMSNWEHSFKERYDERNNKVKISLTPTFTGEFISIEILESGNDPKTKVGRGLWEIEDLVAIYGGRFYPLMKISSLDDACREDYRKKTIIYLPRIVKPQEESK